MPLKILYIFLCFVFVHRSFGNDDAEQDISQSLIANETDLFSIPESSPDKINVTRRNLGYDSIENEECEKAITIKKTLKLLISLLSDSASTNSKTTDVLENLKDLLKNTPAGDAEVLDKIDDLVRTLDKYKEPGDRNDLVPSRSVTVNPKKDGLKLDSRLKLKLEIPALANIYCTQQLLNILKATEQAYLNLARNPVCEIDVSDLPTLPNINSYLSNPNLQFDDWGKSSNKIPYSQNCEKCNPVGLDKNIVIPYYYPVFVDVNPDKNPISPHENPDDYDQVQPIIDNPNKNAWSSYYNLVESVGPNNENQVTVDVNHDKNPGTTHYDPEFFEVKPNENPLIPDYPYYGPVHVQPVDLNPDNNGNQQGPTPNYYPEFFGVKPDKNPLIPDYTYYGPVQVQPVDLNPNNNYNPKSPGQNYYPEFFGVKPDKNPLIPDYTYYGPVQVQPLDLNPNNKVNLQSPGQNYYPEFFGVKPDKNPLIPDYTYYGPVQVQPLDLNPNNKNNPQSPGQNYYPEFFGVKPDKNPLIPDYTYYGPVQVQPLDLNPNNKNDPQSPGQNYYPEFFGVKPDKNPLIPDYTYYEPIQVPPVDLNPDNNNNLQSSGPNYYPEFFGVKPDSNPLIPDYTYYGPVQVQPVDLNEDNNDHLQSPGPNYYPEFFGVKPDKNPVTPDYNPYGPGDVSSIKTPVTPYYYPEYIDVNLDKKQVAPYYNPDATPLGPVNTLDNTPFPYEAAPETLPLNPIFPYIPVYPNPNSENQKKFPFDITQEAVNFVYPNLYAIRNKSKTLNFSENVIEQSDPIYYYPNFPPKETAQLNTYSLYSKQPEHNYGITNPHIANYVKHPPNSVLPYASNIPIYTETESMYSENEARTPQFLPRHNILVNPWETSIPPDQNQNIPIYPFTYQNIKNNYPIEISSVNPDFVMTDIPEYNIHPNNQYPIYPPNEHEISPLNMYSSYVPDQFRPQLSSPNPGPLNDVVPKPTEQIQPLKIIAFVREAIAVIQAVVPVVKFDPPTLHVIAKIKSILVLKDEDIPHEQYSTILDLFGKVIEYVKQLDYYKQIKEIIDSHAVSNHQKLETEKIVELTYLLKQPKPVVYYPYYYVKYSMPYRNFMIVANNLLRQKPELKDKPTELYEELLALSHVVDVSPDLKNFNKGDLLKLTVNAGSLVDTKLIEENHALRKQLNMLKNITSDLTTDEILDLKESNNKYQQLTDMESDNQESVEPFILRDKKEADPNIIIGMQRLNDLFNSPISHSSTFNSEKLRDDILRDGKDSVNVHLRSAINNKGQNNPPANNWVKKLFDATKEASHPSNVMSSNGYVNIDNQKITMNSGSGNRQDAVSVFNPKSTMNLASSHSHDIGINVKSKPNDAKEFVKKYNGLNMINYDNQNIIMASGDSNYQNGVKITNPKLMLNEVNYQESDAGDLESATEQDGLPIGSNPPVKWEKLDTPYKPTPRPSGPKNPKNYKTNVAGANQVGVINHKVYDEQHLVMPKQPISSFGNNVLYYGINSVPHQIEVVNDNEPLLVSNDPAAFPGTVVYYGINGMGMSDQVGGTNHQEQLLISNNPTAVPGSVAYYEVNGMGKPNQVGGKNHEEQLLNSNKPTAVPGSVSYYKINGMGMPNQVGGINNEEQLLISNNPTAVPGSVAYYGSNGMGMPNQVGTINNEEQLLISNNPTVVPGSVAYYGMNGMGMPDQVGEIKNEDQLSISNDPTVGPGSVAYYGSSGIGTPNQVGGINNGEQLLFSNDPTAVPGGLLYYGMNSVAANQGGVLGTQSTILHQEAEQLFPFELEHIVDAEPDTNGINGESIKDSVFDDIQLIEKMKYNGNQSVGGGKGVVNNVLQSITGHDHVLQYTVDSQDQLNLNNNGFYSADANQGMIGQQNLENNNYVAVVGQNNYENDLYDHQQNLGNLGPISPLGNTLGQNIQSTIVHHMASPYKAAHNIIGYRPAGDVLGQKVVIQSVPVIYQRPYSYQRITARRPVVVG